MSCDLVLVRAKPALKSLWEAGIVMPPYGILSIALYLRQRGFAVKLLDRYSPEFIEESVEETAARILKWNPQVVGISSMTGQFGDATDLGDFLMQNSDVRVVHGGTHFGSLPQDALKHGHAVVTGEGEVCMAELLEKGKSAFHGIINGRKLTEEEMNEIPFPTREDLAETAFNPEKVEEYPLITARGCPFDCNFCKDGVRLNSAVRCQSVPYVMEQLSYTYKTFGFEDYFILDDIFTLSVGRLKEITKALEEANLKLRFGCFLHANTVTKQRLDLARRMGVTRVSIGVESGNDNVLRTVGKGTTRSRLRKAIQLSYDYGFDVIGLYMLGNTGDLLTTMSDTIHFARSVPAHRTWFSFAVPFPGTPFHSVIDQYGKIIETDFRKWDNRNLVYLPNGVTEAEMHQLMDIANNVCNAGQPIVSGKSILHRRRESMPRVVFSGPKASSTSGAEELTALSEIICEGGIDMALQPRTDGEPSDGWINVIWGNPTDFRRKAGAKVDIGRTEFSGEKLPASWVACCNEMDEIWVPNERTRNAFVQSGVRSSIAIVPSCVDTQKYTPDVDSSSGNDAGVFTFLAHIDFDFASGSDLLLHGWANAFQRGDNVRLLLMTTGDSSESQPAPKTLELRISESLLQCGKTIDQVAEVRIVCPSAETSEAAILAAADAYVLPSRGTPSVSKALAAMASGLPVIWNQTDNWDEVLDSDNSVPLTNGCRVRAEPLFTNNETDVGLITELKPEELAASLRNLSTHPEKAAEIGKRAQFDAESKWRYSRAALHLVDRIVSLHKQHPAAVVPTRDIPPQCSPEPKTAAKSGVDDLLQTAEQLRSTKDYVRAIDCIRKALQLAPRDVRIYACLGNLGLEIGNTDAVRTATQRIEELEPNHELLAFFRSALNDI